MGLQYKSYINTYKFVFCFYSREIVRRYSYLYKLIYALYTQDNEENLFFISSFTTVRDILNVKINNISVAISLDILNSPATLPTTHVPRTYSNCDSDNIQSASDSNYSDDSISRILHDNDCMIMITTLLIYAKLY